MVAADDLPNALLVGAAKSGTTALCRMLGSHPSLFVSTPKEPRFLVADEWQALNPEQPGHEDTMAGLVTDPTSYRRLFEPGRDRPRRMEASVSYLYFHQVAIPRIRDLLGDVPILVILRHPVDLAVASYRHMRSRGWEVATFEEALALEPRRRAERWGPGFDHTGLASYGVGLRAYVQSFSRVQVLLHEDLESDPRATVEAAFRFLDLEPVPVDTATRHNESRVRAEPRLHQRVLTRVAGSIPTDRLPSAIRARGRRALERPTVEVRPRPETRTRLIERFEGDITTAEELTGRDLSHWRQ